MPPRRKGLPRPILLLAAAFTGLLVASSGPAEAAVVSDNRLSELEGLPALGRGYDARQNTLHGVCFEKVHASEPIFDFYYEFEKVDADYVDRLGSGGGNWALDGELLAFVREHLASPASGQGRVENIVARITLDSYYKTLDESGSPLAPSARQLVTDGRYVAFFNSCGFFYVRSLRYSSTFMALFQFESSGQKEDDERFESLLRRGLFEFGESSRPAPELEAEGVRRGLRVYVKGKGLGRASQLANLVPTSLSEFRQSIQAAAQLMQVASAGMITAVELAPWIEHPDLRSSFFGKLEKGESTFGKTQNLELNSQVVMAVNDARNFWLQEYYLASLCRENLLEYYPVDTSHSAGRYDRVYDPEATLFENHRHRNDPARRITLRQFREYFEKVPPATFLDEANRYLKGAGQGDGAEACVQALVAQGLDQADFTKVPSCVKAMSELQTQDRFLRNYCLPLPFAKAYRAAGP